MTAWKPLYPLYLSQSLGVRRKDCERKRDEVKDKNSPFSTFRCDFILARRTAIDNDDAAPNDSLLLIHHSLHLQHTLLPYSHL